MLGESYVFPLNYVSLWMKCWYISLFSFRVRVRLSFLNGIRLEPKRYQSYELSTVWLRKFSPCSNNRGEVLNFKTRSAISSRWAGRATVSWEIVLRISILTYIRVDYFHYWQEKPTNRLSSTMYTILMRNWKMEVSFHSISPVSSFQYFKYISDLLGEKKTPKGKRKSRVQGDGSDEVKKEFACDLCDRSFSTLGVGSKVRINLILNSCVFTIHFL